MDPSHPRWSRRRFVKSSMAAAVATGIGGTGVVVAADPKPETTRIRLVQTHGMCQAPQYVAEELLRAEGFTEVQYLKKTGPHAIADALSLGEADINMHFSGPLLLRIDRGEPITILGGVHPGCYELFTRERLRTLSDLKGRAIAIGAMQDPAHVFLSSMLASIGLDPRKDVQWTVKPSAEAMQMLAQGKVDAFLGFPPDPQDLRARKIGHVLVNSNVDRPWSQYFCCMLAGNKEFVRKNPVATKRAMRAILKATDICANEPDRASRVLVDTGRTERYDLMRQVLKDIPYGKWRDYDAEDTVRFYALRLHDAGMIKTSPQKIIAQGTDWRFLNELKKELKT
jgi:NitT/TauT family transport system substrate-binding protein